MAGTLRAGNGGARPGPHDVDDQLNEDYSLEPVPDEARVSRGQMTMSAWALLTAMVYLFYGALVAGLAGTQQAFIGMLVTVVVYSVINGVLSGWGIRSGLNSVLMSRRVFGVVGAGVTALLIAANTLYYAVFEGSVVSVALFQKTGFGDIKLAAACGIYATWLSWQTLVVAILATQIAIAAVLLYGRLRGRERMPLGPAFVAGLIAAILITSS